MCPGRLGVVFPGESAAVIAFVGVTLGVFVLSESVAPVALVGVGLVIGGAILASRRDH